MIDVSNCFDTLPCGNARRADARNGGVPGRQPVLQPRVGRAAALSKGNVARVVQRVKPASTLAASLTSNLPGASTNSVLTTPSSTTIA
ncbi:hypothetical protein BIM11_6198 [Burkholderia pseudomallei]|nr:hypothetical protein BIM11_6198 [Burkholderia pseudomallei]